MSDIYATPQSDVLPRTRSEGGGGNVEDAVAGNIDIGMLETLGEAWRGIKGFKLKCIAASAGWFVAYMLASAITYPVTIGLVALGADAETAGYIAWPVQVLAVSVTMPMSVGITVMAIRHSRGKTVSVGRIFDYFHRVPAAILWYFLMTLMIMLGYLLLILPGIYLSFAYMFSLPLLVEKDMNPWRALEVSRKAVTRIWFRASGFLLLILLLMALGFILLGLPLIWIRSWVTAAPALGFILLGIPLIWIVPWVSLAYALAYFKLFGAEPQTLAD